MTQRDAEPQTPTGIEFAHSLMTDSQPGKVRRRPIKEWIAAIEAEARADGMQHMIERRVAKREAEAATEHRATLDVELVRRALLRVGAGWYDSDLTETARVFADEYARLHEGDSR
jgi:hypothetical protein